MGRVVKKKRSLELVTSRSSGCEISSEKLYYVPVFELLQKVASANSCKSIHDINYSNSICPFESEKYGKGGKKYKKYISRTKRAF